MEFHDEQNRLRERGKKALLFSAVLTFTFMICEIVGGILSGSLSLLADASHMLTDVLALGFAFFAFWISEKPPTRRMSYGFHRTEILASLANGILLLNVVFYIIWEAFHRFASPLPIRSGVMLIFAVIGLVTNLVSVFLLHGVKGKNLNLQGAFYHVVSDLVGSIGVIISALAVHFWGWTFVDPLAGILIGILIVNCAWKLLKDSGSILLEGVPSHIDLETLEKGFLQIPGVKSVHDLHVWTISSGKESLSAHLDVDPEADSQEILKRVNAFLENQLHIYHSTIQLETGTPSGHTLRF